MLKARSLGVLLLGCVNSLHILDIEFLYGVRFVNAFSHLVIIPQSVILLSVWEKPFIVI